MTASNEFDRRTFLKGSGGLLGAAIVGSPLQQPPSVFQPSGIALEPVASLPAGLTRTWLGPAIWANRLQDWQVANGRIECLRGGASYEVRSAAILTREIVAGALSGALTVRTGLIGDEGGGGFCGFLVGAGGGHLDYRAAALVQRASGTGGGLLCTYDTDGRIRFREHTDETRPMAFAELIADESHPAAAPQRPSVEQEIVLRLEMSPDGGRVHLAMSAWDGASGRLLAGAARRVDDATLVGGVALVSSPRQGKAGARYFFRDVQSGGAKIAARPDRALGPILGVLYSMNGSVMKLSAQLAPIGDSEPPQARLDHGTPGGAWQRGPVATIAPASAPSSALRAGTPRAYTNTASSILRTAWTGRPTRAVFPQIRPAGRP